MERHIKYKFEEIERKVTFSIRRLLRNDLFLLKISVHELSISHKFAEYIQQEFPDWHVDFDYNKRENLPKELKNKDFRPDIIVHIRDMKNNLLIIEVKKSDDSQPEIKEAEGRVKELTINKRYEYDFGLLIKFNVKNDYYKNPELKWFKDGKELKSDE